MLALNNDLTNKNVMLETKYVILETKYNALVQAYNSLVESSQQTVEEQPVETTPAVTTTKANKKQDDAQNASF